MALHLLVVCTGNVCRSPLAEVVLRSGLQHSGDSGVQVTSAGTGALVGAPMPDEAVELAVKAGGSARLAAQHRARALTPDDLASADLVLTATRQHRADVVAQRPALLRRTFTLREVGRLAPMVSGWVEGHLPEQRLASLVGQLPTARGRWPVTGGEDDLVDPYRQGAAVWRRCEQEALPALAALLDVVAPRS